MIFQTLNGNWTMNEKGSEAFIDAKVPGSALSALLVQHRIQDPYFGTNEYSIKEIFRSDYYFTREFEVLPELLEQERIRLFRSSSDRLNHSENIPPKSAEFKQWLYVSSSGLGIRLYK